MISFFICATSPFKCPTCLGTGHNAKKKCDKKLIGKTPSTCKWEQCAALKYESSSHGVAFSCSCVSNKTYEELLKWCKNYAGGKCQIGRCFESGCLANPGDE